MLIDFCGCRLLAGRSECSLYHIKITALQWYWFFDVCANADLWLWKPCLWMSTHAPPLASLSGLNLTQQTAPSQSRQESQVCTENKRDVIYPRPPAQLTYALTRYPRMHFHQRFSCICTHFLKKLESLLATVSFYLHWGKYVKCSIIQKLNMNDLFTTVGREGPFLWLLGFLRKGMRKGWWRFV